MDIHDHRRSNNITQNSLPTLRTKNMQQWFTAFIPGSAVYYTYPVSVYYRREVGLLGELTEESTMQLINYYYDPCWSASLINARIRCNTCRSDSDVELTDLYIL